jgi:teichoic acid transport system ATP-binding protein
LALKTKTLIQHSNTAAPTDAALIIADNLGIKYEGEKEKSGDFKSLLHNYLSFNKNPKFEPVWALRGVNFTGYAGDVLGVIGANGAGKTTLCRALLGLMKPDRGSLEVKGEVTSLLSLGTGFNKNMTGRENITLNGLMLGLPHKKLEALMPSIEDFSGLGQFLDQPIKYYSTGMKARLGFSIISALEPEILVIDEVLGTGDLEFKARAVDRIHQLVSGSKMVVVVTHDIDFVEENCSRALWLDKGKVAAIGDPVEVSAAYRAEVTARSKPKRKLVSIRETSATIGNEETIRAENLGVIFKLGKKPFWALQDVNLVVKDKEIVGIIGHNGAGKTTLCRTLSGLYKPDQGTIMIKGEITALLSFNLGFNNLLSGYDNIYLNGMMMGIPLNLLRKVEKDIIEFAGLEEVIHKPVKVYSSGMKSRLGFSIAAMLQPDIFVVDEALSAGDMAFREKATTRMQDMLEDAKTVVLVTHSLSLVEKVCTRVIWLQKGKILYDGNPKEAVALYKKSVKKIHNMKKALPVKEDARLEQAVRQYGEGNYIIAERLLEEYLKEHPQNLSALTQYAEIAEVRKKWAKAKKRWNRLLNAAENNDIAIADLAKKRLQRVNEKLKL